MGFKISTILFLLSLSSTSAMADAIQLDAKGKQITLNLAAGSRQPITAYVLSKGNETQYVTMHVQAPNGTKVTARTMVLGSAKPKDLVKKASGWGNAIFMTSAGKETTSLTVGASVARNARSANYTPIKLASTSEYYCGNATIADIDEVILLFQQIQGVTYTRDQLCAQYGYTVGSTDGTIIPGGNNNPGSGYGGGSVSYGSSTSEAVQLLVRKDTCSVGPKGVYLIKFDLDFSGVSAETINAGSEIYLSATPQIYRGSKASSLKPTSDGKFAPRALFLMATTGGYSWNGSGEKLTLVKWNKNKTSLKTLKIEDMVYWRNHSLARVVAEPVLRGGKGVAEIQSNVGVYSVCFKLVKSRQKYNGYS